MGIHIFWDERAPRGIQAPVTRLISAILGISVEVSGNPVVSCGYVSPRGQLDAEVILDRLGRFVYRNGFSSPLLLVIGQDIFRPGDEFLFGLARP
ncbi:MAG: peptidase M54, partial [Methanoregulaceae archaeon]|nr:peptidase M54 [Methanoregulaceae archaeon]